MEKELCSLQFSHHWQSTIDIA